MTADLSWNFETPEALAAFASRLAPFARLPDFIALVGEMGAGKTVFAGGLLKGLGVTGDITSPTYGIVHEYTGQGLRRICHCDFYRLKPGQEEDIGLDEMLASATVVAEWPDAIALAPQHGLTVEIEANGDTRRVRFIPSADWAARAQRFASAERFLHNAGWADAPCIAVMGDASNRTFSRLQRGPETRFLVDWPIRDDGPAVYNGRSYSTIAKLARDGRHFARMSTWLNEHSGVSAPEVHATSDDEGFYLVEDLGDGLFATLISKGARPEPLYTLAVDGLIAIRVAYRQGARDGSPSSEWQPSVLDGNAFAIELSLLLDWYAPFAQREVSGEARGRFKALWDEQYAWLDTQPRSLALRDYHSPNLLDIEGRDGLKRLGVIDFQDAVLTHPAYDLVSLLQDARLTIDPSLERSLLARYCDAWQRYDPAFDRDAFARAYAILGAQRNSKILGIFARLANRDGKRGYLQHIPRLQTYLMRNLDHPSLHPLCDWYRANLPINLPHAARVSADAV